MITAIFATDINGGMGKDSRMPWPRLGQDLAWFKSITVNQTVVMGAGTWFSKDMPKPLPRRTNAVWSTRTRSQLHLPDSVILLDQEAPVSAQQLIQLNMSEHIFVIGGAVTLAQWMPLCDRVYWTHIQAKFDCDTVFAPGRWQDSFVCETAVDHQQHQLTFQITTWNKKA
jgi:dihydrofolate reductase